MFNAKDDSETEKRIGSNFRLRTAEARIADIENLIFLLLTYKDEFCKSIGTLEYYIIQWDNLI